MNKKYLALALGLFACKGDGTGPTTNNTANISVVIQAGDLQFGTRSTALADPLQVIVTEPTTKTPKQNVVIQWSVTAGTGAILSAATSTTDSHGVAQVFLTLGSTLGTYKVQATTTGIIGTPPQFTERAVDVPVVSSVAPTTAKAGDTITVTGQNYSTTADENIVLFGGFKGKVTSATATQLRVVVPLCVPSRTIPVQVLLGAVSSNQTNMTVTATTASALSLTRGQTRLLADPNELACFRLPAGVTGLSVLLIPQNISDVVNSSTPFEITGITGTTVSAFELNRPLIAPPTDFASDWEMKLRRNEQLLARGSFQAVNPNIAANAVSAGCAATPLVGDRCSFQVIDKDLKFQSVTAEVKVIAAHSIILQDINAPANGLTTADMQAMANSFEDPIYNTDIATWGAASDRDGNGRIYILMTPVVNALTARGNSGFVAGFFYGCDLLPRTGNNSCSGSNEAEIFYTLAADPTGTFSDVRTAATVRNTLPPVLAHEFQHMINFGARGNSTDALWLAEGMAHHAEDVIGDVYEARGDATTALQYKSQNYLRGNRFLRAASSTSLIEDDQLGSLELRGAAWLMVKYLAGQFGNQILTKLAHSTTSSVANVVAQSGRTWSSLMSDWAVALWADDAPELAGVTMPQAQTFPNINLRQKLANTNGSYPLIPAQYDFVDFKHTETLKASGEAYILLKAQTGAQQLNLTFTGQRGSAFAINATPQLTILRVQ